MAEVVKILENAEKDARRKLVGILRKKGNDYYGEVLLHNRDGTCSVLQKGFMVVGKTPETAERFSYTEFVKKLSLDDVKEIAQIFAKRDLDLKRDL
ncbi:MAG: hypothetical protein ABSD68_00695 [Candidatus Micrarchaeales archaeon]